MDEALKTAGLTPGKVDHGRVWLRPDMGVGIVVGETSLTDPVDTYKYFSLDGNLFAGPAVCYAYDSAGETIDMCLHDLPPITHYLNSRAVMKSIQRGEVIQPVLAVGEDVLWRWPDPNFAEAQKEITRRMNAHPGTVIIDDVVITKED